MGLTIHYSARIPDKKRIPELTDEVADICRSLEWKSHFFDAVITVPAAVAPKEPGKGDTKEVRLRGLLFTPHKCETVFFTFTPSGRLSSFINLESAESIGDSKYLYLNHVKTQFAGADTHVALVMLFKYLEKKYALKMEVLDEGHYWETLDRLVLEQHFDHYRQLIDSVKSALENEKVPNTKGSGPGALADLIEKILKKKFGEEGKG
jgi:hypothetical protein